MTCKRSCACLVTTWKVQLPGTTWNFKLPWAAWEYFHFRVNLVSGELSVIILLNQTFHCCPHSYLQLEAALCYMDSAAVRTTYIYWAVYIHIYTYIVQPND